MTIKELASRCHVSEQALRKWCARNQVAKDVSQHYIIDETIEMAILKHYGVEEGTQVAQPTETSFATDETTKELVSMLKKELEAKDKQIESLQKALENTTEALKASQESLKASQLLQANAEKKVLQLEEKDKVDEAAESTQQGSSVFDQLTEEEKKECEEEAKEFWRPLREWLSRKKGGANEDK